MHKPGVISANLLVVLLIGTAVGALVGLGLGGIISNPLWLGIVSGFLATIIAGAVRHFLVSHGMLSPKVKALPGIVILMPLSLPLQEAQERWKLTRCPVLHPRFGSELWLAYFQEF